MSLKTWASGEVPRASKIWELFAQRARWNSNIFRALGISLKRDKILLILHCKLQSWTKVHVVGTFELDHVFPIPPNQCWKMSCFSNKKGKNLLIINIVSGGRGELASCPNFFSGSVVLVHYQQCEYGLLSVIKPKPKSSHWPIIKYYSTKILKAKCCKT